MERIERPGRLIALLSRVSGAYMARAMRPFGLAAAHYPVLMVLYRRDGLSQEELAQDLQVDKSAAKRTVDPLVAAGYVRRERNPLDRRAYRLYATEKALVVRPALQAVLDGYEAALSAEFSPAERAAAIDLLNRMARNAVAARNALDA